MLIKNKRLFVLIYSSTLSFSIFASDRLEQLSKNLANSTYNESDLIQGVTLNVSLKDTDQWNIIKCQKDRFNGSKFCAMSKNSLLVSIYNGHPSILVGSEHFPRKSTAIKIDGGKTFYGSEGSFDNQRTIIDLLSKGKIVYTRYVQWPYEYNVDDEISLDGFNEAYKELKRRYSEL